jgi:glycosyltransferase involved in cell wall biosynthesis
MHEPQARGGNTQARPLAVLVASLAQGGVGKMRTHLINRFSELGHRVDLLLGDPRSPYMDRLHPKVRVIDLGTSNAITGVPALARYLWRERPEVLLSQRIRVNVLALRARNLIRSDVRVYVTSNTNITSQLDSMHQEKRAKQLKLLRKYYPQTDGIMAVSQGVADDTAAIIGMAAGDIRVIHNPVITAELENLAAAAPDHPWFGEGEIPVLLGVGRLEPQKDFPNLIRAFARVRERHPCRLMILGEGALRAELQGLADRLGVGADLAMPGFVRNPYRYMRAASLFVLSSRWEGSPNGLTEALAVGTPVVATDCPNGPNEILQKGRLGPLVPMGDDHALALAILETLANPHPAEFLRAGVSRYSVENSAREYLAAMGLPERPRDG